MNLAILLSVFTAFVIVFSSLLILNDMSNSELARHLFFLDDFTEKQTILIIGSSHVSVLNASHMNNMFSQQDLNYTVFNLSYNGDKPSVRINHLSELISLNPKLVIYGISYRDFTSSNLDKNTDHVFPDPKSLISEILPSTKFDKLNPKYLTFNIIKDVIPLPISKESNLEFAYTPFISFNEKDTKILNNTQLLKNPIGNDPIYNIDPTMDNYEVKSLKKIVQKLNDESIPLIIFSTPLHKYYLETIPDSAKQNFNILIDNIHSNSSFVYYDLSQNYSNLQIWTDLGHISLNEKSIVYTDDIMKLILKEIGN